MTLIHQEPRENRGSLENHFMFFYQKAPTKTEGSGEYLKNVFRVRRGSQLESCICCMLREDVCLNLTASH